MFFKISVVLLRTLCSSQVPPLREPEPDHPHIRISTHSPDITSEEDSNRVLLPVCPPPSLQAVKQLLELPLNLAVVSPAHTPNWDLVSDVVNSCSRVYRSPKQCRNRYENVVIPREEGKVGVS